MNSSQFIRYLRKQGIEVKNRKGTGHRDLYNPDNGMISQVPVHGSHKQLGTGLMETIKKDLGLK